VMARRGDCPQAVGLTVSVDVCSAANDLFNFNRLSSTKLRRFTSNNTIGKLQQD
jgi:hypothetical protein